MDTEHYKKKLERERDKLSGELGTLGTPSPTQENTWNLKAPELDIMEADQNEAADRAEEAHIDQIVLDELSIRQRHVQHALSKIENGTFGTCEVCQKGIESDRLDANPAARTCKEHMGEESTLAV